VRFVVTVLLWLVTTIALAVAVPAAWAQKNLVDVDGYAAFAQSAARDPQLQDAMASALSTQLLVLAAERGYHVNEGLVRGVANAYTASPSFPGQFAQANRVVHQWMFTNSARKSDGARWEADLGLMLADSSFQQMLNQLNIEVPTSVTVPVALTADGVRPGQLRPLATWGPWVSIGAAVLAGASALLTLASARQRGKALAALGVSALLVGAGGWAALEVARRYIDSALNRTTGDIRRIAELNLTLAAGGVLVVFGVIATMIGGLRKS
jgi:hypothetical protein